jgi:predicted O-methyltransferase YrrM
MDLTDSYESGDKRRYGGEVAIANRDAVMRVRRPVARARMTWREIRRLRREHDPDALLLARLLAHGTMWPPDAEGRRLFRRIEAARRALEQSDETVRLQDDVAVPVRQVVGRCSQSPRGGRLLYAAVRGFRPTRGVELGTCLGISAAYQATALAANGQGRLVTLEGFQDLGTQAEKLWRTLGLDNVDVVVGQFAETLGPTIEAGPVDYAYIDGNHHEEPTLEYFRRFREQARGATLLVFDDIRWSDGMRAAWERIRTDAGVTCYADLGRIGLLVVRPVP